MNVADSIPAGWVDLISPEHPLIGLGMDVGTTENKKSNPSALALTQSVPPVYCVRLLVAWKSADPSVAGEIIRHILERIPHGLRAKKMCIDATSERFFAAILRRMLAPLVTVKLVNSSTSTLYKGEQMSVKSYLGNLLCNLMEDGKVWVPNETWVKTDMRLVVRDKGTFDAPVHPDGWHGDTFDAVKLSLDAIVSKGGGLPPREMQVGQYSQGRREERFPMRAPRESAEKVVHLL